MAVVDFLKTMRSKDDLRVTLEIIEEFKGCENFEEWGRIPFVAWEKLEQLEEYLKHLVNGTELEEDTLRELKKRG
jgi:hypothetical protein